jgi:hypothetical protein
MRRLPAFWSGGTHETAWPGPESAARAAPKNQLAVLRRRRIQPATRGTFPDHRASDREQGSAISHRPTHRKEDEADPSGGFPTKAKSRTSSSTTAAIHYPGGCQDWPNLRPKLEKLPFISDNASLAIITMDAQYIRVENTITPGAPPHSPPTTAAAGTAINCAKQYQNRNVSLRFANKTGGRNTSMARLQHRNRAIEEAAPKATILDQGAPRPCPRPREPSPPKSVGQSRQSSAPPDRKPCASRRYLS